MKNLTKLLSLAMLSVMLLAGCTNKAQVTTTKTTNDNTKTTTSNSTDTISTDDKTTDSSTTQTNNTTSENSTTDLSNLNADSKKIYDIIVAKYPTATLLTDDEKKLIDDYIAKYSPINNHKAKDDEEYKNQTVYVNIYNLADNYKRYSELKSKNGDQQVIGASQREIDRIINTQKF